MGKWKKGDVIRYEWGEDEWHTGLIVKISPDGADRTKKVFVVSGNLERHLVFTEKSMEDVSKI